MTLLSVKYLEVAAGTERWVQFATARAYELEAQRARTNVPYLTKAYAPEDGTLVWVKVGGGYAKVHIIGTRDDGSWLYVDDPLLPTQAVAVLLDPRGRPVGPFRQKLGATSTAPYTVSFDDAGLAGSEYSYLGSLGESGTTAYAPTLGGRTFDPTGFFPLGQYLASDGTYRFVARFSEDLLDPDSQCDTVAVYDPEDDSWSEATAPSWPASAIGASTGVSVLSVDDSPVRHYLATVPSPFPGSIGGDYEIKTPVVWFMATPGGFDVNPGHSLGVNVLRKSYVTSATPGAVVTDFHIDGVTPLGYGCWVDVEGTDEVWISSRNPDTMAQTEIERVTRDWTAKLLLAYNAGVGHTFAAVGGSTALRSQSEASTDYSPLVFDTGEMLSHASSLVLFSGGPPNGHFGLADLSGGTAVVKTWHVLAGAGASTGPQYTDAGGGSNNMAGYTQAPPEPHASLEIDGVQVWTTTGTSNMMVTGVSSTLGTNIQNQVYTNRVGFQVNFLGASEEAIGVFWDGATADVLTLDSSLDSFTTFVQASGARYVYGSPSNDYKYFVNGVQTATLDVDGANFEIVFAADRVATSKVYTVPNDITSIPGKTYTLRDGGYTTVDFDLADTWEYDSQTWYKFGDFSRKHTSWNAPALAATNATAPPT
jgi:hypothetical protein